MDTLELLYTCNANDIYLYVEEGKLKYTQMKEMDENLKKNLFELIKYQKIELISLLLENKITSFYLTRSSMIYRVKSISAPLSFAQERLWFIEDYEGGSNAYNIPLFQKLSVEVDIPILEKALKALVSRHEVLHSLIKTDEAGNGYQEVVNLNTSPLLIAHQLFADKKELIDFATEEANHIFKLDTNYPLRISILKEKHTKESYILVVVHHIAFDGWSIDIFLRELSSYYKLYKNGESYLEEVNLPKLSIQYKDFAVWQRNYLRAERLEKQLTYWKKQLSDYEGLNLPIDKPRPVEISYEGEEILFSIHPEISNGLRKLAKERNVSLYSVLLAGFNLLLRSYANQNDIVVGTPIANRHYPQLEELVGFFVNSLALRSQINAEKSLAEYVTEVGHGAIEAQLHQDLPFEKLVAELEIPKDPSRHPIFQVMFGVQSFGHSVKENSDSLFADTDLYVPYKAAKFDITVFLDDSEEELQGNFNYVSSLFTRETIEILIKTYRHILEQFVQNSSIRIKELRYLDKASYEQIIYDWNQTKKEYSEHKTIHQLFEEQVQKTPDQIAVVHEGKQLTYRELNKKANQLAHYLQEHYQLKADDLVALCVERNEYMLIGILATLKAGAAYVPIDPNYPEERISYILADTQAKVALTNESKGAKLLEIVNHHRLSTKIEIIGNHIFQAYQENNFTIDTQAHHLAYVIYTSGTTGTPKGVMIEHKNVVAFLQGFRQTLGANHDLSTISTTQYVFDIFVLEYGLPLLHGYTIELIDLSHDILIENQNIDISQYGFIQLTPSKVEMFLSHVTNDLRGEHRDLTWLIGGEAMSTSVLNLLADAQSRFESIKFEIRNVYGPTEATVWSTQKLLDMTKANPSCIGKLLPNETVYLLDSHYNPLPIGAVGELYIGGLGLARGYLNLPELTKERFFPNPFQTEQDRQENRNGRIYKTGDLARYLANGNIDYIGRNDFQVKVRGFRIELGEIENKLSSYPGIKQAVVLVKEHHANQSQYLVGYYVAENPLNENAILSYLESQLTDYMIPNVLVRMKRFPLTINGKLDRKALPDPEFRDELNYVAPRNDLEQKICEIYAEVLQTPEEKIGIQDSFFSLGGSSILAIKLVNKLNKKVFNHPDYHFKHAIAIGDIFKYKTITQLLNYLLSADAIEEVIILKLHYNPEQIEQGLDKIAPLSFAQERLWFIEDYEGGSKAYNIPLLQKLSEDVDIEVLERALRGVISRHEILHSLIKINEAGNGYQEIMDLDAQPLNIDHHEFEVRTELIKFVAAEANHIFNLDVSYPIKIYILKQKEGGEKYLFIVVHHIAFDGWSIDVFLRDLLSYYELYEKGESYFEEVNLPKLSIQYKDFAVWQRNYLRAEGLEKQLTYWKTKLSDYEGLNLLTDKPRPITFNYEGEDIIFSIDAVTSRKLRELAKERNVSLYSVLLAGFNLLLRSYANQNDIVVGTPIANRHYPQLEDLIGFFVNNLALRSQINPEKTLTEYISEIGQDVIEAQLHQDLPFEKLVTELDIPKDPSRHPLFQIMFGMQSFGRSKEKSADLKFASMDWEVNYQAARFDMSVFIDDSGSQLQGIFNYAKSLYKRETIEILIKTYLCILEQLARTAFISIKNLSYVDTASYKQMIYDWNKTEKEYPSNKTLAQLFEEQVRRIPDHVAVVYEDTELTYQQLNAKADQIAGYIQANYQKEYHQILQPDTIIAFCLPKNVDMLASILGILKVGAAYLPIDHKYPSDRIHYLLQDSQAALLLTQQSFMAKLEELSLDIPVLNVNAAYSEFTPLVSTQSNSHNLAYVIYTSGTTGQPKGVLIEHKAVINTLTEVINFLAITEQSRVLQFSSISFDAAGWDIFGALLAGACLVLADEENLIPGEKLTALLQKKRISIASLTPVVLEITPLDNCPELKTLAVGGEKISLDLMKHLSERYRFINAYGPTEVSICAAMALCDPNSKKVTIGKPLANVKLYVLNADLQPLPAGFPGELYISGVGLARGYLNLPELTAERFVPNPFQTEEEKSANKNNRLYKSGDLVRFLPDGNLEYLDRNDSQVKLRGFRIELGEIESLLASYPQINQAIVLVRRHHINGERYLAAYYVADKPLDYSMVLNYLKDRLPEYMLPNILIWLEKLPLTINGKLDRKALPDPEFGDESIYVAPRNELEYKVCETFAKVLSLPVERVGIKEDFFRLGGSSISAIQLTNQLNKKIFNNLDCHYDHVMRVTDIFKYKTIENLLDYLLSEDAKEEVIIPKLHYNPEQIKQGLDKIAPLSFAQERLWFIEDYEGGSNAYNIPLLQKLAAEVDIPLLKKSLKALISRHEVLHSLIKTNDVGNGYQEVVNLNTSPVHIEHQLFADKKELIDFATQEANHIFKLDTHYPLRINILEEIASKETYLLVVVHHIAFDGWSINVFIRDLKELYHYYYHPSTLLNLPKLSIQYKDFAIWQRDYLSGERLAQELTYWKTKLSDYEGLNLPIDKPRPVEISYEGEEILFRIHPEISNGLRNLAKERNVSLYSVLLAGFNLLLRSYANQNDIVVGTPIANRHYPQLEDLVGFFVNNLALRSQINAEKSLAEYVTEVGHDVIEAQLHQDLPFEKLVAELEIPKDTSRHPIFQVMFGVQSFGHSVKENCNSLFADTDLYVPYKAAKFDITVFLDDSEEELQGNFNYVNSLFTRETIELLIKTYRHILEQFVQNSSIRIKELRYLDKANYEKIIYDWNQTKREYSEHKTIHQLFEEQVQKTPNQIAVMHEGRRLTYRELNQQVNQLAHYLRENYQLKADDLVALCLERNEHMLIAILATFKAGAAYVPIDLNYPDERISYILADTQAKVVLTNEIIKTKLSEIIHHHNLSTKIEIIDNNVFQSYQENNLAINAQAHHLAYVIYTSGTTGTPKGVMIEHRSVAAFLQGFRQTLGASHDLNTISTTEYVFDIFVLEYGLPLLYGYTIEFIDLSHDILTETQKIDLSQYGFIQLTPSKVEMFLSHLINDLKGEQKEITWLIGGEALSTSVLNFLADAQNKFESIKFEIRNVYGPTEATVWSTQKLLDTTLADPSCIGRPLANETVYLLDSHYKPLPIGAIGELYIGGLGLARGYLNLPELTKEKFIPNPFQTEQDRQENRNGRIYKTGDLARYLTNGDIDYIGRNDFQVKVRGFRIELGEIENKLSCYPGIKQAVVLVKEHHANQSQYLVGYYVAEKPLDENAILSYLGSQLPDYIVPNILVKMKKFPLTINGKLDRKSLPDPEFRDEFNYVAPRNDLERQIGEVFVQALNLPPERRMSIRDDFFRLGGSSILAIKLISMLNTHFNVHLRVVELFTHKSVEGIARLISDTYHQYQGLIKLNKAVNKRLMFMIHAARAGCEVYIHLAKRLENVYECYGIDNYNLYHQEKIANLNNLADYYLKIANQNIFFNKENEITLLGWSLGGLISFEIATILEKNGFKHINIYLLDTFFSDEKLRRTANKFDYKSQEEKIFSELQNEYEISYARKIAENYEVEIKMTLESPSAKLQYAKIVLFKAMQEDKTKDNEIKPDDYREITYNNLDKFVFHLSQLKVINIEEAHHDNILKFEDYLLRNILKDGDEP